MQYRNTRVARVLGAFCFALFSSFSAVHAVADDFDPRHYDLYLGDINNDGVEDAYLKAKDRLMILAAEINTPIQIPPRGDSFSILSNGTQSYSVPIANNTVDVTNLQLSNNRFLRSDFNNDGYLDALVHVTSAGVDSFTLAGTAVGQAPNFIQQNLSQVGNYELSSAQLSVGDVNGDGREDVLIAGFANMLTRADGTLVSLSEKYSHPGIPTVLVASQVGTTAGEFRVDESGNATYNVPIATVSGTAGVAPQVSLAYASQSGNGLVGKGWSISGLSAITRCRQTLFQDKAAKPIQWTEQDRFCLDGQRLIVNSGSSYGAVGAAYKTETDSFAKITSVGGTLGNPGYFKVERKDGSVSFFGNTTDAKLNAGNGKALTWALNRFEDSVGNPIVFEYTNDADGQRIDKIRYAYGSGSSSTTYLDFSYQDRPDEIAGYLAGYEFKTRKLLNNISSYNEGTLVRSYQLSYMATPDSEIANQVSKLTHLQECKGDYCLPATHFNWSDTELGFDASTGTVSLGATAIDYRPADINGDGYMDLVWIAANNTLRYFLSDGNKLVTANFANGSNSVGTSSKAKIEVIDYNADGRNDIAVYNSSTKVWNIYLAEPQSSGDWKLGTAPIALTGVGSSAAFKDFNSDGLIDVMYWVRSDNKFYIRHLAHNTLQAISSSQYFHFGAAQEVTVTAPLTVTNMERQDNGVWGPGRSVWTATVQGDPKAIHLSPSNVDFNSDGRSDLEITVAGVTLREFHRGRSAMVEWAVEWQKRYALVRNGDSFELFAELPQNLPQASVLYEEPKRSDGMNVVSESELDKRPAPTNPPVFADINGDSLTDVLYYSGTDWNYQLNTGTGFAAAVTAVQGVTWSGSQVQFTDYNGDGYQDLRWVQGGQLKVKAWDGTQFGATENIRSVGSGSHLLMDVNGDARPDYVNIVTGNMTDVSYYPNKNANQVANVITRVTNGLGNETDITYATLTGSDHYENLRIGATSDSGRRCTRDGCFDYSYSAAEVGAFYSAINTGWETTLPGGSQTLGLLCPIIEFNAPITLVTDVASSAPVAGNLNAKSSISYYYAQARMHAAGRGFLGFEKVLTVDNQTQVETTTTYRQDWPFIGYPLTTEVRKNNGDLLSLATNTWAVKGYQSSWGATAYNQGTIAVAPIKPFISQSVEQSWQANSITNSSDVAVGALLQTVTTTNTYDDYGNPLTINVATVNGSDSFTKNTVNQYGAGSYDQEMGRLSRATVTSSRHVGGVNSSETRTSAFTYYTTGSLKGLLKTEVIEPDNALYTLTTTHEYDAFGNKTKATQSGTGVIARYSRSEYDAKGRYVNKTYNAYEQLTKEVVARNGYGAPTQVKNIDGVVSHIYYSELGREYLRTSATGAWDQSIMQLCTVTGSNCPTGAVYTVTKKTAGGGESAEYFDVLGRSIRKGSRSFDGTWVYQNTEYDSLGRAVRVSNPYSVGSSPLWTTNEYDMLGRVIKTTAPDASVSRMTYSGLDTTYINAKSQTKTERKNALGELVQVLDYLGGKIQYGYDAQGNLTETKAIGTDLANGVSGTITTTLNYDLLGRKTSMSDPDKGNWQYTYNRFGELIEQQDAKGQRSVITYDVLGRKLTQQDYKAGNVQETNLAWNYNNNTSPASSNGLGQLIDVTDSLSGYIKLVNYDAFGRADETVTSLGINGADGDHYEKITYDSIGRPLLAFDAARDSNTYTDNGIRNVYNNYGYLHKVVDFKNNASGQPLSTYYEVLEMDAFGHVTKERLGNGYTTTRGYDIQTGRQTRMLATLGVSLHTLIDVGSDWDELGNLTKRTQERFDINGSQLSDKEETFGYDGLNRLTSASVTGGSTLTTTFDSFGNIKTKSDVGTYSYAGVNGGSGGPHAVTNTDDGTTSNDYHYDANGNLTQDDTGRTLSYTSFDKPDLISKGNHQIAFEYGPDRKRYKRVDTNTSNNEVTTTLYIGSVEKVSKPDGTREVKRYINGVAIVTQSYDAQNVLTDTSQKYQYKDHLGSILLITEQGTGSSAVPVAQGMSFDPWGKRRNDVNWAAYSASQLTNFDHSITTRGFTGHEMLDEVGLIHMNGRIYDPHLARFVQADPFIDGVKNLQGFNRYSYVLNNPLNATDPSGFLSLKKAFKKVASIAVAAVLIASTGGFGGFVSSWYGAATIGAISGGIGAAVNGGNFLKGALIGGVSGAAFQQIGAHFSTAGAMGPAGPGEMWFGGNLLTYGQVATQISAHALVGGVMAELQGGKFGHGFGSAGFAKFAMGHVSYADGSWKAVAGRTAMAAIVGGTVSEATGGKFANGAGTAALAHLFNAEASAREQKAPTYEEKIKAIAAAYRESGLEFTQEDAVMALKTAMSNDRRAIALINRAGDLSEAQMQLALETSVVMSYSGESIELIGESGLVPLKGARWAVKNATGHDFDLMDIRENLNDNFTSFGFGLATRVAGTLYIARPSSMGRFHQLFDPNVQGL